MDNGFFLITVADAVASPSLLLKRPSIDIYFCLRFVPAAVANTFRFAFVGYPKGLAVGNRLSIFLSSFSFSVCLSHPSHFPLTRSPSLISLPSLPGFHCLFLTFTKCSVPKTNSSQQTLRDPKAEPRSTAKDLKKLCFGGVELNEGRPRKRKQQHLNPCHKKVRIPLPLEYLRF